MSKQTAKRNTATKKVTGKTATNQQVRQVARSVVTRYQGAFQALSKR